MPLQLFPTTCISEEAIKDSMLQQKVEIKPFITRTKSNKSKRNEIECKYDIKQDDNLRAGG